MLPLAALASTYDTSNIDERLREKVDRLMPAEKKLRIARNVMSAIRCAPDPSTDLMARVIADRLSENELDYFQYVLHLAGNGSRNEVARAHDKRRERQTEGTD